MIAVEMVFVIFWGIGQRTNFGATASSGPLCLNLTFDD